jgi:ATP-dependent RNA helicase SUPV3L1/SUV3
LESLGFDVAVIYGSMPPSVKMKQAKRFNDPNDKCKILVATDAIGKFILFQNIQKIFLRFLLY